MSSKIFQAFQTGGTGHPNATSASTTTNLSQGNHHANDLQRRPSPARNTPTPIQMIPPQYLPDGNKSLPGVGVRAYCLGIAFGICSLSTVQLAYFGYGLWRIPFFVAALSAFHYLEFDMTARFNPPDGGVGSFLLLSNGPAYTIAHTAAMTETALRYWMRSQYWPTRLHMPFSISIPSLLPSVPSEVSVLLGIVLVILGQTIRSVAMKDANTNFNHVVQSAKKSDHVLVTHGVYALSRHPSYFGFFWWGLGTQLVLGNYVCFLFYTTALWQFFSRRIKHEEKHLVEFFGQEYLTYRERVGIGIPFIQ